MSDIKVSLFSQILGLLHRESVKKVIPEHNSDKFSKGINTWTHLVSMVFMQISNSGSLRNIASGLMSATGNLNHFGIVKPPCKSSLSYLNKNRNYEVFRDIYFTMADKLVPHRPDLRAFAKKIKKKIYCVCWIHHCQQSSGTVISINTYKAKRPFSATKNTGSLISS